MKKLALSLALIVLCCGVAIAQNETPETNKPQSGTVQSANSKTITKNVNSEGVLVLSICANFKNNPSRFVEQLDYGRMAKQIPLFGTIGIGFSNTDYSSSALGQTYSSSSWSLRVPGYVGYKVGSNDKLHAAIRGGVVMHYLLVSKVNKEKVDLSGIDRTSWNGSVKLTIGYGFLSIMAEYEFPFQSGVKDAWLFGICSPF